MKKFIFLFGVVVYALAAFTLVVFAQSKKEVHAPELTIDTNGMATVRLLENEEHEQLDAYREQITKRDREIKNIEQQIEDQEKILSEVSGERKTLEGEVRWLNLENRKEKNRIRLTQEKIRKTNLTLTSLKGKIQMESQNTIFLKDSLGDLFRFFNETEKRNPYLSLLTDASVFESVHNLNAINKLNEATVNRITTIQQSIGNLQRDKSKFTSEEQYLQYLTSELRDRQAIAHLLEGERRQLLTKTQNEEIKYQEVLNEKREELAALISEVMDYESKMKFILDPQSIPVPYRGVFRWPIGVAGRFTQLFGQTAFARANAHLYGRPFHDGVDFGLPVGTPIVAAGDGVVIAMGNTGLVRRCRLWGKWILLRHNNGLSTIYAHLSLIKVFPGQKVKKGDLIAYSGNTGNSTGPHLHFGVYATQGIKVVPYESFSTKGLCNGLSLPLAAQDAKIDPQLYLAEFFEELPRSW